MQTVVRKRKRRRKNKTFCFLKGMTFSATSILLDSLTSARIGKNECNNSLAIEAQSTSVHIKTPLDSKSIFLSNPNGFTYNGQLFIITTICNTIEILQGENIDPISKNGPSSRENYSYIVASYGFVYIFGGTTEDGKVLCDFHRFSFNSRMWESLPSQINGFSKTNPNLVCLDNQLILLAESMCYIYDKGIGNWRKVFLQKEFEFSQCGICTFEKEIFVHGGIDKHGNINKGLYRLSIIIHGEKHELEFILVKSLVPRWGHQLIVDKNFIYILGGNERESAVCIYSKYDKLMQFKVSTLFRQILFNKHNLIALGEDGVTKYLHPLFTQRIPFVFYDDLNLELFQKLTLSAKLSVHICDSKELQFVGKRNFVYKTMEFEDFKACLDAKDNIYLRSLHSDKPFKKPADIRQDYKELSSYVLPPCLEFLGTPYSLPLRIASAGLKLWGHYDCLDNILIQYQGTKQVILLPPSAYLDLQMEKTCSAMSNWKESDFEHLEYYAFTLHPGDHLYIPSGWIHFVESTDITISVNIFYKHLPESYFLKDIYSGGDLVGFTKAMKKMDEIKVLLDNCGADSELTKMYAERLKRVLGN